MPRSSMAAFSALWRAYGEGRLERSLHLVAEDCEVTLPDGRTFLGRDGIRECLESAHREWRTLTVVYDDLHEEVPGWIVGVGRVSASSADGATAFERPLACAAEFRAGLLVRGLMFDEPADAAAFARESPAERSEHGR